MSDGELWAAWRFWMLVAAVVILVAAALLVTIWLTARSIAGHARRALAAPRRFATTRGRSGSCRRRTRSPKICVTRCGTIEAKAVALVEVLESHAAAGGRH